MLSATIATPEPLRASNRMTREPDALGGRLAQRAVLVVDDSEAVRTAFDVLFSLHGLRVLKAKDPEEALAAVRAGAPDLILQDMNFRRDATSGEEGIALFRKIRALEPDMPIVLLTAWTHLETAVELVKEGAADYLAKPWDDTRLLTTIANLLDLRAAREENLGLRTRRAEARGRLGERFDLRGLVYESEAMHTVVSMATQVAAANIACLITGPNGAGKEVIADLVQANSMRRAKPYVKVNAGALPDDLLEAELFGTEVGAYTGAKARTGRFEEAAASSADRQVRTPRLERVAGRGRPHCCGDQCRLAACDSRGSLSRRFVLSIECDRACSSFACGSARGCAATGACVLGRPSATHG
jgi:FixJ family two-component response regulator